MDERTAILIALAPVFAGLITGVYAGLLFLRSRYGTLRLSELPALFWTALAGAEYRRQLRLILDMRERRRPADEFAARVKELRAESAVLREESAKWAAELDRIQAWREHSPAFALLTARARRNESTEEQS
jgi:hypothetical protein